MAITAQQQQNIIALTVGMFNAAPGARNLSEFAANFEFNNGSYVALANDLIATDAYQRQFDGIVTLEGRANNVLSNLGIEQGTDAYTEARAYFEQRINEGVSEAELIVESLEYLLSDRITEAFESVQAQLNNKVDVATFYSVELQQSSDDVDVLRGVIDNVTADPATVDAAIQDALGGTGGTQALTPSIDVINGTAGNDTFIGTITDSAETTTLNSGDTINGGAGNDTLRVLANGDDNVEDDTLVTLNNVENVSVRALDDVSLDAIEWTGVENVITAGSNSDVAVSNLGQVVDAQLTNTSGDLTLGYQDALLAGDDIVQNVAINGAEATFTADGVSTFNANVNGAFRNTQTNVVQFAGDALNTINLSGEGNLSTVLIGDITTFDASEASGDLTVDTSATGEIALTGGEGDDTFLFGDSLTANDTVDGGEGFNTLRLDADTDLSGNNVDAGDFSSAANAARFNNLENIQRVAFDGDADGNGVTVNGSTFTNTGITNIEFNTQGDDFINNAGAARTYELGAEKTDSATFNMNASSTEVNVDLFGDSESAADVSIIDVNLSGTQPSGTTATVNLTSMGVTSAIDEDDGEFEFAADNVVSIDTVDAVSGSDVNLAGEGALFVGGFANNANVDASELEGGLIISGSSFADGLGEDDTAAQGVDTFTLGAGRTVIQFDEDGSDSGFGQGSSILFDTVTGFKVGSNGDVLDITDVDAGYAALNDGVQAAIDALSGESATMVAATEMALNNGHDGDAGWTAFSFQGNTYALYENGDSDLENNDTLVQLSGVSVEDLTAANFA